MSLRQAARLKGTTMCQNGENPVHPPFQSARIWIKNSKVDVGFLKMNDLLFSTRYGGAAEKEKRGELVTVPLYKELNLTTDASWWKPTQACVSPVLKLVCLNYYTRFYPSSFHKRISHVWVTDKPDPNIFNGIKAIIFSTGQRGVLVIFYLNSLVSGCWRAVGWLTAAKAIFPVSPFLFLKWSPKHDRAGTHPRF